eukprot:g4841.t1
MAPRESDSEIVPVQSRNVFSVVPSFTFENVQDDVLFGNSPFQYARLSTKQQGTPLENYVPASVPFSTGDLHSSEVVANSSSSLPQSLHVWAAQDSTTENPAELWQEASLSLMSALGVYSSRQSVSREHSQNLSTRSKSHTKDASSLTNNPLASLAALFCARKAIQTASGLSTRALQGSHSKKAHFQYIRKSIFEEDWESRKTCLISVNSLSDRVQDVCTNESSPERVEKKPPSSLGKIYDALFSSGSAESYTRLSLPLNRGVQTKNNSFSKTTTGSGYELSDLTYTTVLEFNGVWKAESDGEVVQRALIAMSMKKKIPKIGCGGVQYLLIDSTRSHFRTGEWTNTTQHKEQRPWNGDTVCTTKSSSKTSKRLSVNLTGSRIEAITTWSGVMQARLIQEYTLSPDLKRLKVEFTMEKGNHLRNFHMAHHSPATKSYMVHTMYFKRQA